MLKPIRRESLVDNAVTTIHNYIIDEAMQPGDPLPPERQLAGALVISRMTLRHALAILEGKGTIRRDRGRAVVAASMVDSHHMGSPEALRREFSRLTELRYAIEVGTTEYACQRRTQEQLARLHAIVDKMAKDHLADLPNSENDVRFHLLLLECAGEELAESFGDVVQDFFRMATVTRPSLIAHGQSERIVTEHRAILDALEKRDADELRRLYIQGLEKSRLDGAPVESPALVASGAVSSEREGH